MNRYFNWILKHSNKVPKFHWSSAAPKVAGKLTNNDLITMYDLRMYHIQTHPSSKKHLQYVRDLEFLHRELNSRMSREHLLRWLLAFGLLGFFISNFAEESGENENWGPKRSMIHELEILSELDEGGEEGEE